MSRSLSVFVAADPQLPVPPRLYGGIERVIALLVARLQARGHRVTLFAHADSRVACELVPYRRAGSESLASAMGRAATLAREAARRAPDVIHSFGRLACLLPVLPLRVPKVMSYQREITPGAVRRAQRLSRGSLSFVACSRRMTEPVASLVPWHVIYNAVPTEDYEYRDAVRPDAALVFLGRVERIKGTHLAIEVARRAGRDLVIAGTVPDAVEHQEYFRDHVQPFVDGRRVTWIGAVDDKAKNELLGHAAALLMPIQWEEPFGIVMAEALACGTPVIGLDRGAVPEVVRHGATGFVCSSVEDMAAAVGRLATISRHACRLDAEARFSGQALADAYESVYMASVA